MSWFLGVNLDSENRFLFSVIRGIWIRIAQIELGLGGRIPSIHDGSGKIARRAGVPSGEARRVILRELEIWVILGPEKSVQHFQCDPQNLNQNRSD